MKTWMVRGSVVLLAGCLVRALVWNYSEDTVASVPHEIKTNPGRGHGILGEDAWERAITFFKQHLHGRSEALGKPRPCF